MRKSLLAILALLTISSVALAAPVRGYRVNAYVSNEVAVLSVFNGSIFTMVCSGVLAGETVDGAIVTKEIKKLIVPGDKRVLVKLESEYVMVEAAADLKCYR